MSNSYTKNIISVFIPFVYLLVLLSITLTGCSSPKEIVLMPTPVLYDKTGIDPFAHLPEKRKNTTLSVFYSTTRVPKDSKGSPLYGNQFSDVLHFGKAVVRIGGPDIGWDSLLDSTLYSEEPYRLPVSIESLDEVASFVGPLGTIDHTNKSDLKLFANSINQELEEALDKEIMVYVHGTKVDFTNSVALTAEVDHFAGRDFVGVAFAWPSHQNIFSYLIGIDVGRAREASTSLGKTLTFLAENTDAERINVLSYSAGGRVLSLALHNLFQDNSGMAQATLREKYRLGSVVFAAADVPVDSFLERLHSASQLAEQVVITVTDGDNALHAAKEFMGGEYRAGTSDAEDVEEQYILERHLGNVEIIDVSANKKVRGFDITGHHYWYRHPWMSSDIIFLMRTNLPPNKRGLTPTELEGVWYLSPDYPEKIKEAVNDQLGSQWGVKGNTQK